MNITLLGAGGKMGGRITANLQPLPQYKVDYVEASEERRKQMADAGIIATPIEEALGRADAVILGVPDRLIGKITHEIVPKLKPGTIVVGLDPAAAYAGVMPKRGDITYFIAHPCHPPLFSDTEPASSKSDWFGKPVTFGRGRFGIRKERWMAGMCYKIGDVGPFRHYLRVRRGWVQSDYDCPGLQLWDDFVGDLADQAVWQTEYNCICFSERLLDRCCFDPGFGHLPAALHAGF